MCSSTSSIQLTETKVAGKNVIVTTAIAFIAEASLLASSLIRTWTLLSLWDAALKAYRSKSIECVFILWILPYQSNFILYPSVVRARPLQQIFEELKLKGQAAANPVPSLALSCAKSEIKTRT